MAQLHRDRNYFGIDPLPRRLGCGHMGFDPCETCEVEGDSPDPWMVADAGESSLNRLAETRAYRQSKFRER